VQLLFAVKTFLVMWILLAYTNGAAARFVGFEVDRSHEMLVERLNKVCEVLGGKLTIAPEATYFMFSVIAAYISFTVVRPSINFGFYFFFITRAAQRQSDETMALKSEGRRFSFRNLVRMLYANFFAPVVIVFLFV
jgi:hypothetical protein